jgi:hypothetical protein
MGIPDVVNVRGVVTDAQIVKDALTGAQIVKDANDRPWIFYLNIRIY